MVAETASSDIVEINRLPTALTLVVRIVALHYLAERTFLTVMSESANKAKSTFTASARGELLFCAILSSPLIACNLICDPLESEAVVKSSRALNSKLKWKLGEAESSLWMPDAYL